MQLLQILQVCALITLSVLILPLSTSILFFSYILQIPARFHNSRKLLRHHPAFRPRNVLVTGAGTAAGLRISRALYEAGHNVMGADFEPDRIPVYARFSKAFKSYHTLRLPNKSYEAWLYIQDLLRVVQKERVHLWINCSNRISAVEDAQARQVLTERTDCVSVALGQKSASNFSSKANFLAFTKTLGLPTPEIHPVRSRAEIHDVLNSSHGRKRYLLNTGETASRANSKAMMLPRRTLSQTYSQVSMIKVTKDAPLVLEQHFEGMERYATFAIIVRGEVLAFAASPITDTSSCYQALPTAAGVGRAMLQFMQVFAERAGEKFTTHVSVEFRVQETGTDMGFEATVIPVTCHTQPGLATLLFFGTNGSLDLAKAYLSVLDAPALNGDSESTTEVSTPSLNSTGIYFIGTDLVSLVLRPTLQLFKFKLGLLGFLRSLVMFVNHVVFWREGTYELWDPLPLFLLYHVFLPVHLVLSVFGTEPRTMSVQ